MLSQECKNSMKRVRACIDHPSRTERRLVAEIRDLLSMQIPIALSRIAVCRPISMLGSSSTIDGAAFREVDEVVPFLQQIMSTQGQTNVVLGMVLQFVSPALIRKFSLTRSSPYWMNIIGGYEFPSTTALALTSSFSPWGAEGTTCVYSVANGFIEPEDHECIFVPVHLVPTNVLPLYLIKYSIRE